MDTPDLEEVWKKHTCQVSNDITWYKYHIADQEEQQHLAQLAVCWQLSWLRSCLHRARLTSRNESSGYVKMRFSHHSQTDYPCLGWRNRCHGVPLARTGPCPQPMVCKTSAVMETQSLTKSLTQRDQVTECSSDEVLHAEHQCTQLALLLRVLDAQHQQIKATSKWPRMFWHVIITCQPTLLLRRPSITFECLLALSRGSYVQGTACEKRWVPGTRWRRSQ